MIESKVSVFEAVIVIRYDLVLAFFELGFKFDLFVIVNIDECEPILVQSSNHLSALVEVAFIGLDLFSFAEPVDFVRDFTSKEASSFAGRVFTSVDVADCSWIDS